MTGHLKRALLAVGGTLLLLTGGALLVLPGPGLILVLAGLVLLSAAFPRLERHLEPVREQVIRTTEESVSSPFRLIGAILTGLGLIGAGIAWGTVDVLPFSGWPTGSGLIVSGLLLLTLLAYSFRQVRGYRNDR